MSFTTAPTIQLHGKASSPYTTPAGVETLVIGTWDRGYHLDRTTEIQSQVFEQSTAKELSVKILSDIAAELELSAKVVRDLIKYVEKITQRSYAELEPARGIDKTTYIAPIPREIEQAYGYERSLYGETYTTTQEWEERAQVSEERLRYVKKGDKVFAEDILSLRNALLDLVKRLWAQGFDPDYLFQAEQTLKQISIASGSFMYASVRNSISQALVYICKALLKRSLFKLERGFTTETSILSIVTNLVRGLRVHVRNTGADIYMDSANVITNLCPTEYKGQPTGWTYASCQNFASGWDHVFWVEDTTPLTASDQDFEDVVIRVKLDGTILTVDVWHGEHSYTNDVYWGNTLLGTAYPRSAPKYNLAYLFTKKIDITTNQVVG